MYETALALCKTPIIGIAMWLSSMCVTHQALKDTFIDISKGGLVLHQDIEIPMSERYSMILLFHPAEKYDPHVHRRSFISHFCASATETVETWNNPEQKFSLDVEMVGAQGQQADRQVLEPLCDVPSGNLNHIHFGWIDMKRGRYKLAIHNPYPVSMEVEGRVQVILRARGAGYP